MEQGALPIPGAKDGIQARENAGSATFTLSQAEVEELREAAKVWVQEPKWKMSPMSA